MTAAHPTILILDGTAANRTFVKACLNNHAYQFLEADNSSQGLSYLYRQPVDLIILNLYLPGLESLPFLECCKAHPIYATVPVVVCTAQHDLPLIQHALALGSHDYFIISQYDDTLPVVLPLKVKNAMHTRHQLAALRQKNTLLHQELQAAEKYQGFLLPQQNHTMGLRKAAYVLPGLGGRGDFCDGSPRTAMKTATLLLDFYPPEQCPEFSLSNDLSRILPVVETILAGAGHDWAERDRYAIKVSLLEMLSNAMEHGNLEIGFARKRAALAAGTFAALLEQRRHLAPYAARRVTLSYAVTPQHATFTIRDRGQGFDWNTVLHPARQPNTMQPYGRGLLIAQACMDSCTFNAAGNEVTLTKHFAPPGAAVSLAPAPAPSRWDILHAESQRGAMHAVCTSTTQDCRIALAGHLELPARQTLQSLLKTQMAQGMRTFILDFAGITFMDSSGLGALVACLSLVRKNGGTLQFSRVPAYVYELMDVTRLLRLFDIRKSGLWPPAAPC